MNVQSVPPERVKPFSGLRRILNDVVAFAVVRPETRLEDDGEPVSSYGTVRHMRQCVIRAGKKGRRKVNAGSVLEYTTCVE